MRRPETARTATIYLPAWMLAAIRQHDSNVSAFVRQAVQRALDRLDGKPVTRAEIEAAIRTLVRMDREEHDAT